VIHEDHVGLVARQVVDGRFGRISGIDRDFVTFENARQEGARGFRIVHDQSSLGRHQHPPDRTSPGFMESVAASFAGCARSCWAMATVEEIPTAMRREILCDPAHG
jgi:hypothetical protein